MCTRRRDMGGAAAGRELESIELLATLQAHTLAAVYPYALTSSLLRDDSQRHPATATINSRSSDRADPASPADRGGPGRELPAAVVDGVEPRPQRPQGAAARPRSTRALLPAQVHPDPASPHPVAT